MIVVDDATRIALNAPRGSLLVIMETNDARCTTCGGGFKKNERAIFAWDMKRHAQPSRLHREGEGVVEVRHDICRHKRPMPEVNGPYTSAPPAQAHSETSRAAAAEIAPAAPSLREQVYELLAQNTAGLTDEEGSERLGMALNTYRPRRIELVEEGRVFASSTTRKTRAGRLATVWLTF